MNTPEERNANHTDVDAQSRSSVDTGTPVVPEEITELRDLHATALCKLASAEDESAAAKAALIDAAEKATEADVVEQIAEATEAKARREYIDALRRHGYVQTADGPKLRAARVPDGSERNVHNPRACDLHLAADCPKCAR